MRPARGPGSKGTASTYRVSGVAGPASTTAAMATAAMSEKRLKAALAEILAPLYPDPEHELARVRDIARRALSRGKPKEAQSHQAKLRRMLRNGEDIG